MSTSAAYNPVMPPYDVQVRGAGIVGKALALSLARLGLSVALRSPTATAHRQKYGGLDRCRAARTTGQARTSVRSGQVAGQARSPVR